MAQCSTSPRAGRPFAPNCSPTSRRFCGADHRQRDDDARREADPWDDFTEALPAFLTIVVMTLTVSITDGIAVGFISIAALMLATGRGRELHALTYGFAGLLLVRYLL